MYHMLYVCCSSDYRSHLRSSGSEVQLPVHTERDSGAVVCSALRPRHIQVSAVKNAFRRGLIKFTLQLAWLYQTKMFSYRLVGREFELQLVCNILVSFHFYHDECIFDYSCCVQASVAGHEAAPPWGHRRHSEQSSVQPGRRGSARQDQLCESAGFFPQNMFTWPK